MLPFTPEAVIQVLEKTLKLNRTKAFLASCSLAAKTS